MLQIRQRRQHFRAVSVRLYSLKNLSHDSVRIDYESVAGRVLLALKLGQAAVLVDDLGRLVGKQLKV